MFEQKVKSADRISDILDELVDLRRHTDELCAEAIKMHNKKGGDHVRIEAGAQSVIVHVSCKLAMDQSHYQLVLTEHIAKLSPAGRPLKARLQRQHIMAEEWLDRGSPRRAAPHERRLLTRPAPNFTEI